MMRWFSWVLASFRKLVQLVVGILILQHQRPFRVKLILEKRLRRQFFEYVVVANTIVVRAFSIHAPSKQVQKLWIIMRTFYHYDYYYYYYRRFDLFVMVKLPLIKQIWAHSICISPVAKFQALLTVSKYIWSKKTQSTLATFQPSRKIQKGKVVWRHWQQQWRRRTFISATRDHYHYYY